MIRRAEPRPMSRRLALRAAGALALGGLGIGARAWAAHGPLGLVEPPRPAPSLGLQLHDGRRVSLPALLAGRITAVQLMFTGCSATCPIQGAVFASVQDKVLDKVSGAQLLSISIDPLRDDVAALDAWRKRFGARPGWLAGAPALRDADVMLEFLSGRANGADRHTAQVYLFDRQARFAYRFAEFAPAADLARGIASLAAMR